MKKRRVGIFGGTFNPPHIGHIEAAKAFVLEADLDELLIIPAFIPPHKEYLSSVGCDERLEMCRLAFSDIEKTKISDIEIARGGKSYTYLTLEDLAGDDRELYLLVGTDMILTMDEWKKPEIIFKLADICYVRRECDPSASVHIERKLMLYRDSFCARIHEIKNDVTEISSSELRAVLSSGRDVSGYLTPSVEEFIKARGLYQ